LPMSSFNRRLTDIVAARDAALCLAGLDPLPRLALLVISKFGRSAHFLSARHGPRPAVSATP
jgi:hypothetical protein